MNEFKNQINKNFNLKTFCLLSGSSIIIAHGFYNSSLTSWTFIFGATAFLFNPIIPIHLNKSSWILIDFISAILFFLAAFSNKNG